MADVKKKEKVELKPFLMPKEERTGTEVLTRILSDVLGDVTMVGTYMLMNGKVLAEKPGLSKAIAIAGYIACTGTRAVVFSKNNPVAQVVSGVVGGARSGFAMTNLRLFAPGLSAKVGLSGGLGAVATKGGDDDSFWNAVAAMNMDKNDEGGPDAPAARTDSPDPAPTMSGLPGNLQEELLAKHF